MCPMQAARFRHGSRGVALMAARSMVIGMSASGPPMQFGASGDATDPWCDRVAICPEAAAVERCAGTPDGLP